jgi:hypothetical protein
MKTSLLILFSFFSSLFAYGQVLSGKVINEKGEPLPAVSIYIEENKQGTITNIEGEFEMKLPSGTYHLEIRSLGYEVRIEKVQLKEDTYLTITLINKDIQLEAVNITPGEDPAYGIMRKAIEKAPYYESLVKSTTYEIYSKGSGKLTHVPSLFESLTDGELDVYKDKLFLQESVSEITYTAPSKYDQKVLAYSSTFPDMKDPEDAMMLGLISLYHPTSGSTIMPMNPKAFSYYRFRYEGFYTEDNQDIFIIRIIPKLNDPKLIKGVFYIADETWDIRYAEFERKTTGITMNNVYNYHPVMDNVYLVTAYETKADISLMGVKMWANFLFSVKYTDIQLKEDGEEIIAQAPKEKKKKSLEIKREDFFSQQVDSMAIGRDSVYWAGVRNIVLNEEEKQSYELKEVVQHQHDSLMGKETDYAFSGNSLLFGGKAGSKKSAMNFSYGGLLGAISDYNFMDGLWLGQSFGLDFKKGKNKGLIIQPSLHYVTARKALVWDVDLTYDYAPMRFGHLAISAGDTSTDYSGTAGMNRTFNKLVSVLYGKNYARLHRDRYVSLNNSIDIANGLNLALGAEYRQRDPENNHTTYNLFGNKKRWQPNLPDYAGALNLQYTDLMAYSLTLSYTPEYYYSVYEGKKRYVRSRFPTFALNLKHGLDINEDASSFFMMQMAIRQELKLTYFSRLNYTLAAGKFFNKNDFNYIDYKHFNTSETWFTVKDWQSSYVLLPYYTYSTNDYWAQAFVNYNTDYLLLKRLPFMQGKLATETLQAKFLHTPNKKFYNEWGYSVDLPGGLGGVGVFVSFDGLDYKRVGFQLNIPLFDNKKGERTITIGVGQ